MNTDNLEIETPQGNTPKFSIQRAKDPDIEKILNARMSVLTDSRLPMGARTLFVLLLELALNPFYHMGHRGQVAISNTQLRERLHASKRGIYGWTHRLIDTLHIWVSAVPRPNTHPMNMYHITGLQPRKFTQPEVAGDACWGNGYRRPSGQMPQGARGKKQHLLVDLYGRPLITQVPQNEPAARKDCGSLPQNLRETGEQKDPCHPQNLREDWAENAPATRTEEYLPSAKNAPSQGQKPALLNIARDVRVSSSETELANVQRSNASKRLRGQGNWMEEVAIVLRSYDPEWAKNELINSGGWWVTRFQKDPRKAERVLAEINRKIKEREPFTKNPGACAVELWKEFA